MGLGGGGRGRGVDGVVSGGEAWVQRKEGVQRAGGDERVGGLWWIERVDGTYLMGRLPRGSAEGWVEEAAYLIHGELSASSRLVD